MGLRDVEWPANPFNPFFNINRSQDVAEAARLLQR